MRVGLPWQVRQEVEACWSIGCGTVGGAPAKARRASRLARSAVNSSGLRRGVSAVNAGAGGRLLSELTQPELGWRERSRSSA